MASEQLTYLRPSWQTSVLTFFLLLLKYLGSIASNSLLTLYIYIYIIYKWSVRIQFAHDYRYRKAYRGALLVCIRVKVIGSNLYSLLCSWLFFCFLWDFICVCWLRNWLTFLFTQKVIADALRNFTKGTSTLVKLEWIFFYGFIFFQNKLVLLL